MRLQILCGASLADHAAAHSQELVAGVYPYGMEHLEGAGFELTQRTEPGWLKQGMVARIRASAEPPAGAPLVRTMLSVGGLRSADASLAVLDREGVAYARLRALGIPPMARVPLVVISCWLGQTAQTADARGLRGLRRRMKGTDLVVFWSRNQRAILREKLGLSDEKLFYVPFGVESDYYVPGATREAFVAAVGDSARDYRTLLEAAARVDVEVRIATKLSNLSGLRIPPNVTPLGRIDHAAYRDLLQRAAVVVNCVEPGCVFPLGQSVLLQAMACGAATVMTDTVPISDYVRHGVNTLLVEPREPSAVAAAIETLLGDDHLRAAIGAGGRRSVEERFNAAAMWRDIGAEIARRFAPSSRRGGVLADDGSSTHLSR